MDKQLPPPSSVLTRTFELPSGPTAAYGPAARAQPASARHGFRVGSLGLLLPEGTIGELFNELAYCRLPNTATALLGMANKRGDIIPVFDLYGLSGVSSEASAQWRILVVGADEDAVGLRIDGLPTRMILGAEDQLKTIPPLPAWIRPYARACYRKDGFWVDWDLFEGLMRLSRGVRA